MTTLRVGLVLLAVATVVALACLLHSHQVAGSHLSRGDRSGIAAQAPGDGGPKVQPCHPTSAVVTTTRQPLCQISGKPTAPDGSATVVSDGHAAAVPRYVDTRAAMTGASDRTSDSDRGAVSPREMPDSMATSDASVPTPALEVPNQLEQAPAPFATRTKSSMRFLHIGSGWQGRAPLPKADG